MKKTIVESVTEMTAHEAMNDISHELMQRHTDMIADGCDAESVRMLEEEIGKRQLIVREALNELEELKKEVVGRQETEDSLTLWVNELTDVVNAYKNARCEISDILVDVDKFHYTAEKGVQMIRKALYKLDTAILELDCENSRRKLKNEN